MELESHPSANPTHLSEPLPKALDVGCGAYCLPGALGFDRKRFIANQIVGDINQTPWPLPSNHFEFIRCQHVVEHIADLPVLVREMHRVAAPGAEVHFITPHYSCMNSWGDPTHLHHFALPSLPLLFAQNLEPHQYRVKSNTLTFTGAVLDLPGWLIYKMSPRKYEKHFAWIWPANEIHTRFEILK